jgi:hypothetical protein
MTVRLIIKELRCGIVELIGLLKSGAGVRILGGYVPAQILVGYDLSIRDKFQLVR